MGNSIYDVARYRLMTGAFDWINANLVLTAWSGALVFDPGDELLVDVAARGAVVRGVSDQITSKTVAPDGTAQTNQVVIPGVTIGAPISFFTMSDDDQLVLFIDTAVELPFIPNGLDMVVQPDWLDQRGWWKA